MKRMSAYELERRSEKELCVLFQIVSQNLIRTKRGTRENISRVRARQTCPLTTTDEAAPTQPGTASFMPSPGI
jgi:hypothetical protein